MTIGETVNARLTMPVKPLILVNVMVDEADDPGRRATLTGLAEMLKMPTLTVTTTAWERRPLVPVTVTE